MKHYTITIVALGSQSASAFAAKSSGTLSERPLVVRKERRLPLSAAPFVAITEAIKDLRGFLHDGDAVDVNIHVQDADVQTWISRGSGDPHLDTTLRNLIRELGSEGISVSLHASETADRMLRTKAEMALLLN